jgi:cyclopropane fatty-acyl-phospholipid synthase-like methyltransferase
VAGSRVSIRLPALPATIRCEDRQGIMRPSPKAEKYPDLHEVYSQCSGPGALRTAEFVAEKIGLRPGMRVLDIGIYRGIQTCFLAREYECFMVAVDPWVDDFDPAGDGKPYVDHLRRNAESWGVEDRVLGLRLGLPEIKFADMSFDAAYSTTAMEMIRGLQGDDQYLASLKEVLRVLKPGGVFGLAEPMHRGGAPPPDLDPLVSEGPLQFKKFLATPERTAEQFREAGFDVVDVGHAPDAREWWEEFALHDDECQRNPEGNPRMLAVDAGRWLSFGYVIGRRPALRSDSLP